VCAVAALSGCSKLPSVQFDSPFGRTDWVELQDAVVVTGSSPALAVTVVNQKDVNLSLRVEIDEIDGRGDCANSFRLGPDQKFWYSCPQPAVKAGARYRTNIRVYKDWGQTKLAERIQGIVKIEAGPDGSLRLIREQAED
jgi:hypothetical protein